MSGEMQPGFDEIHAKGASKPRRAIIDGRTYWAKRRLALIEQLTADLGREPSVKDTVLISTAASTAVRVEQMDRALTRGLPVKDEDLVRLSNALTRLLKVLGIKATPAKPTVSLRERIIADEAKPKKLSLEEYVAGEDAA
jgi:hypothetical protein